MCELIVAAGVEVVHTSVMSSALYIIVTIKYCSHH